MRGDEPAQRVSISELYQQLAPHLARTEPFDVEGGLAELTTWMDDRAKAPLPWVVRCPQHGDWRAVKALRLQMLAECPRVFGETLENAQAAPDARWINWASEPPGPDRLRLLAITPDGYLVGQAGGVERGGYTELVGVYVSPVSRGTGVIEDFVQSVAAWAALRGRPELRLFVAGDNARAIAAYTRLGFRQTGVSQPHELHAGVTEIEMVLRG